MSQFTLEKLTKQTVVINTESGPPDLIRLWRVQISKGALHFVVSADRISASEQVQQPRRMHTLHCICEIKEDVTGIECVKTYRLEEVRFGKGSK